MAPATPHIQSEPPTSQQLQALFHSASYLKHRVANHDLGLACKPSTCPVEKTVFAVPMRDAHSSSISATVRLAFSAFLAALYSA